MEGASPISFSATSGASVRDPSAGASLAPVAVSLRSSRYQRNPTQRSTSVVVAGGSGGNEPSLSRNRSFPVLLRQMTETSRRSSARLLATVGKRYRITNDTHSNNLQDMFSGLYAMCLTVLGATLPVAKVFATEISIETYEAFYIYLYVVSIVFMIFVHVFILHYNGTLTWRRLKRFCRRTQRRHWCCGESKAIAETAADKTDVDEKKTPLDGSEMKEIDGNYTDCNGNIKETDITDDVIRPSSPEGSNSGSSSSSDEDTVAYTMKQGGESFYLRLGAVVFGIVFMTMTGLKLGHFIELAAQNDTDVEPILIVRPIIQLIFILVQLYFIFVNSTICIHRYQTLARFGTMHLIATNLCLWLRVITIEIVREIHLLLPQAVFGVGFHEAIGQLQLEQQQFVHQVPLHHSSDHHNEHLMTSLNDSLYHHGHHRRDTSHVDHHAESTLTNPMLNVTGKSAIMESIIHYSSSYIYPCSIEYCFIAAGIHLMIWSNIGTRIIEAAEDSTIVRNFSSTSQESLGAATAAVVNGSDSGGGGRGSLRRQNSQRSFLMKHKPVHVDWSGASRGLFAGILLFVLTVISIVLFYVFKPSNGEVIQCTTQIILYSITLLVVFLAAYMFRDFKFRGDRNQEDNRRLDEKLLVLSLIGVFLYRVLTIIAGHFSPKGSLVLGTSVLVIVEAVIQTVFILNALHRIARTTLQQLMKPGRNAITFLLLCNVSIWCVNIFQGQSSDTNYIAMSFYGPVPWTILAHISIPLAIFHQFHVTLCLSTIWKTAYKSKRE